MGTVGLISSLETLTWDSDMGNCLVVDEQTARSREIQQGLKHDFRAQNKIIKLLLLGTGESGKSTIVKQMKIINNKGEGYPEEERKIQIGVIRKNVLDSIEQLLLASKHFGFQYSDSKAGQAQERILQFLDVSDVISRENSYSDIASDIKLLWEHPVTKECLKKKNEFQFLDSAPYFLDKASEISSPDYKPSDEDVLRARSQTTGIITFKFQSITRIRIRT